MRIEYKEKDLLGGWSIAVIKNGVTAGHIRKHGQDGSFVFYKGAENQLTWSLKSANLDALKVDIENSLA